MDTESGLLLLRTSVRPKMQKRAVIRGIIIGIVGILLVWLAEVLLPMAGLEFESLGIWRWIASGGALGASYLPYNQLRWRQENPEILQATDTGLTLLQNEKPLLHLAWQEVDSFCFLDRDSSYGLAVTLKVPKIARSNQESDHLANSLELLFKQEEIASSTLPLSPYQGSSLPEFLVQKSKKEYGVDLFFPYFSQHSCLLLQQWYDQNLRDKIEER